MLKFIKTWILPLAMLFGALAYPLFIHLAFLTPYLIFIMLLLTFSKVAPSELKLERLHLWLILIQLFAAAGFFFLLLPYNKILAEGAMICLLCPTATAAAVVTQRLGGSAASVSSYTLLSNVVVAFVVPIIFPLIEHHAELSFLTSCFIILKKVFLLLILPFLLACFLRRYLSKVHLFLEKYNYAAFYVWAFSLIIVMGKTVQSLVVSTAGVDVEIMLAVVALLLCLLQFYVGKRLGSFYGQRTTSGQMLGQKNTILAIWMAYSYLNPLTAVAPGAYMLWQNMINSYQLWRVDKK